MNTDTMGVYGNYYLKRAMVAQLGLGANLPEDAIYPLNLSDDSVTGGLQLVPSFLLNDMGLALRALASPLMLGGLLFSAACFWLLLRWRQRGASAVG